MSQPPERRDPPRSRALRGQGQRGPRDLHARSRAGDGVLLLRHRARAAGDLRVPAAPRSSSSARRSRASTPTATSTTGCTSSAGHCRRRRCAGARRTSRSSRSRPGSAMTRRSPTSAIRADEDREGYISHQAEPRRPSSRSRRTVSSRTTSCGSSTRPASGLPSYYSWRTRSGCFFCFFQRKYEWVRLSEEHPDLFREGRRLRGEGQLRGQGDEGPAVHLVAG